MTNSIPEIDNLYTIKSVRETNSCTLPLIKSNQLENFKVDLSKLPVIVDYVVNVIQSEFKSNEDLLKIPIHGRFQHFEIGQVKRVANLISQWQSNKIPDLEICKKLIDLFIVSVLLDAGAGNVWSFHETETDLTIGRSEGIAVASYHMFIKGVFSDKAQADPFFVNGDKLKKLTAVELAKGLQISNENQIAGFDGRLKLLNTLGETLSENKLLFGNDARPGNIVDYLINEKATKTDSGYNLELEDLWNSLMQGFTPIWPTEGRIKVDGQVIGDAWFLKNKCKNAASLLNTSPDKIPDWQRVVTFHKLTQWLTYSLFVPLIDYGHFNILHSEYMTGLPEYRNGGLFVDFELLQLKEEILSKGLDFSAEVGFNRGIPTFKPDDDVIVEWRSCTICLLDMLLPLVNEKMGITGTKYELSLPQMIEAGSWKSGRFIAKKFRDNGGPPIELYADGTVF
ncbi:hypothetical protein DAMA08_002010 [Martiniozyma asiatica (nom. inval.)]|nr:hypothetical protein DAMA08_002010 [Martiniozyma asiatica]